MTAQTLVLLPDTNLFIQCRALDQLDWSIFGDFAEIELLVTRPVQTEIDKHKNQGGARLATRARTASSVFREIIRSSDGFKIIRETAPRVTLAIRPEYNTSSKVADRLDYNLSDDRLVGTIYSFVENNPGLDARLLTHDTGPMGTAKMLGLPFEPIPDAWLLPPETSETEKEIKRLSAEISRYKRAEPEFSICNLDGDGKEQTAIDADQVFYDPLSDAEVTTLLKRIEDAYPLATHFGPRESTERASLRAATALMGGVEVFTPATAKEIEEYRDKRYPEWLEACEQFLRDYHLGLELQAGRVPFNLTIANMGARPGNDVLVEIEAKGAIDIEAYEPEPDSDDIERAEKADITIPRPPEVPRGTWRVRHASLPNLNPFLPTLNPFAARVLSGPFPIMPRVPTIPDLMKRRDPNGIFWKPKRPMGPTKTFVFECEQWRHSIDAETFSGQIVCGRDSGVLSAALECRVHAANLSNVAEKVIPVKINVRVVRAFDAATALVDEFVDPVSAILRRKQNDFGGLG